MEIVMSIVIGIIFGTAIYLMFSNNIIRVLFGTLMLSLEADTYTDPLPQAMILTAIVINFAITAFMFVLAYRIYQDHGTLDLQQLRGAKDE